MQDTTGSEFESAIGKHFDFLRMKYGFSCKGIRFVEDPQDSYVFARFTNGDGRIDVAWNEGSQSLSILLRLCNDQLERKERYVYFEPFVEFMTKGQVLPLAPQIYPLMSLNAIESVMRQRNEIFKDGFVGPLVSLSQKLDEYLGAIQTASVGMIREYQRWYSSRTT